MYSFNFKNKKINIIVGETPFGAPYTSGQNIYIPADKLNKKVLKHEIIHIYFRYFESQTLKDFCKEKNIVKIIRPKFKNEIKNPDTTYDIALVSPFGLISPAVTSPGSADFYTFANHWRPSTIQEINYYNRKLPFNQNYHPEEILAEIYSS